MGAQTKLNPIEPEGRRRSGTAQLPRIVFVGVAVGASALLIALSRGVFLFWDDFVFLGQARESDLTWSSLTDPLFKHFSPVVRLVNLLVVDAIPHHPWVIPLVLFALLVAVVSSSIWLMVVLHGRTAPALVGSLLVAPSLTLLQLGNWWTAGANILPALAGFYVSFGAMVLILAGRSRWWALACFAGAAIAVLDYELPMLLCGYLGLWYLLFGRRVTDEPWRTTLRRTWWVWGGVIGIGLAAAVNYRVNYYDEVARPGLGETAHATARSLLRTLVPTLVGFHDPKTAWFSALSLAVGIVALAGLVIWLVLTREGAWRGLLFAGAGWLLPSLALILNRVSIFGVTVVDNAIYFHLPTVLFVIGILEAWVAPRREDRRALAGTDPRRGLPRVLVATLCLVPIGAYAWSAGPTSRYQLPVGAGPSYIERARESAAEVRADVGRFSVINSDVPGSVVPGMFKPFNRADRVLGLTVPGLTFDQVEPPHFAVADTGELVPVTIDWVAEAAPEDLSIRNGSGSEAPSDKGLCHTAGESTSVVWPLDEPISGPGLVVRTVATVDGDTPIRVVVRPQGAGEFDVANSDVHNTLTPSMGSQLDTVAAPSIATLRVKGFTPGVEVCVESVSVGVVRPAS